MFGSLTAEYNVPLIERVRLAKNSIDLPAGRLDRGSLLLLSHMDDPYVRDHMVPGDSTGTFEIRSSNLRSLFEQTLWSL